MSDDLDLTPHDIGVWMTVSELAKARGVGVPALSMRVSKLKEQGLVTTKPGKGRSVLVNVVEFDLAVGQTTDLAREQGQATRRLDAGDDEAGATRRVYTANQARRAGYDAELARLDLMKRLGGLVDAARLRLVLEAAFQATARAIDSLAHDADALRELAQGDDVGAFDRGLRDAAHRIRRDAAIALREATTAIAAMGEGADGAG